MNSLHSDQHELVLFEEEIIETWGESENPSESNTTKEKNVKHIVETVPAIKKVYFNIFRTFKCQRAYDCERQSRPNRRLNLNCGTWVTLEAIEEEKKRAKCR